MQDNFQKYLQTYTKYHPELYSRIRSKFRVSDETIDRWIEGKEKPNEDLRCEILTFLLQKYG